MQMKSGCARFKWSFFLPSLMACALNRQAQCTLAVFSLRRGKSKNADSTRTARIALHGQPVWVYPETSLMDVSGTIRAILNQKSRDVFAISPYATVFEAIQMMDAKNVGALLVIKEESLIGIISERDYTRKVVLRGKRSRETKVAEIMSTNVFTTNPGQGVDECLRIMTDKHIRHLPVLDGDKVVGVISIGDLVKHVISCQQAAIAHLESYIHGGYLG